MQATALALSALGGRQCACIRLGMHALQPGVSAKLLPFETLLAVQQPLFERRPLMAVLLQTPCKVFHKL